MNVHDSRAIPDRLFDADGLDGLGPMGMSQFVITRLKDGKLRLVVFDEHAVVDEFAGETEYIMRLVRERLVLLKAPDWHPRQDAA